MPAGSFDASIVNQVDHRPWPMPDRPWVMTQSWHDLLFAHWPSDAEALRAKVPSVFPIDLFDGQAWVGVVPFHMTNVSPRGVPALPWISAFPELNVRTYVRVDDRPGVFFFSLDAGSAVAVRAARALLNLPYFTARMTVAVDGDAVSYDSQRDDDNAQLTVEYEPRGPATPPVPGSLEYFLTERYCLYHTTRRGAPYRMEIHHPPWPLQAASARISRNTMGDVHGLTLPGAPALLHFAKRQDMVAWAPTLLA